MRNPLLSLLFVVLALAANAQYHLPDGDISMPPLPPAPMQNAPEQQPSVSRSGNHYKIPFDTIQFNRTIGTGGFDIVICIDGVTNNQQIDSADNYVDSLVRRLQNIPHYAKRFKYFNIYRVAKFSNEQGSNYGFTNDTAVDNRYGSRFNAYNLPRLLLPIKVDTLFADVNEFVPQHDLVLMLAFDKKYGGSGWNLYDGRKVASFSIDEEYGKDSYHLGDEVIIHEMQHIMPFAGRTYLADEYEDAYACSIYDTLPIAYKNSPNYTSDTTNNRKWQHWIDEGTPGVGFYDSAGVCPGNYRPTHLCAMRQVHTIPAQGGANHGMPPFCPVCRENSTAYFDSVINPVYFSSPAPVLFTGSYLFQVSVDTPLINTFRNQWLLDDSIIATGVTSLNINFAPLGKAKDYVLKFVCTDTDRVILDTTLRRPWVTSWTLLTKDTQVNTTDLQLENQLNLYPNPATNQLILSTGTQQPERLFIYDTNGRKIKELKFNPQIDISTLPSGMYFIEAKFVTGAVRKRFVKE